MSGNRVLVRNAADPNQVRAAETRDEFNRRQEVDDMRAVMSTPVGRRFVWRFLERGKPFVSPFQANSLVMAHACGLGDQARTLWAELFANCPELLVQMANENDSQPETKEQKHD